MALAAWPLPRLASLRALTGAEGRRRQTFKSVVVLRGGDKPAEGRGFPFVNYVVRVPRPRTSVLG